MFGCSLKVSNYITASDQLMTAAYFLQHLKAACGPSLASAGVLSGAYLLKLAVPSGVFRGGGGGDCCFTFGLLFGMWLLVDFKVFYSFTF